MGGIISSLIERVNTIDFSDPISFIDLLLSIILVISVLFYLRKFPVFRVFLGILFLFVCSLIFFSAGFTITALLFGLISNLVLIALPLIFAPEIRHYLEKLGRFPFISLPKRAFVKERKKVFFKELENTVYGLAKKKIGATIVMQRRTGLAETIETGTLLNAQFSKKLVESIFFPKSPLHDGAVVTRRSTVIAAGCLLPISSEIKLDPPFGTRHKSAIAITQDTDAVVLVVSEQRGQVSVAENGKLHINVSSKDLNKLFQKLFP